MIVVLVCNATMAQKKERKGEFYFSWGYNKEWYTHSTVRVMQPELGNDYKMVGVKAHDHPGWDEGLFQLPLTIPQYNYRIGYFFNKNFSWYVPQQVRNGRYDISQSILCLNSSGNKES